MDNLTFVADLIGSIAWPVTTVMLVLLVRKPLLAMLPLVQSAKYGDFEVSFERVSYLHVDQRVTARVRFSRPFWGTGLMVANPE